MILGMCSYDDLAQVAWKISQFEDRPSDLRPHDEWDDVDDEGELYEVEDEVDESIIETVRGGSDLIFRGVETNVGADTSPTDSRTEAF